MHGKLLDPAVLMAEMGRKARDAAALLARMPSPRKAEAVLAAAAALRVATPAILAANAIDIAAGEAKGLSGAMLDRLLLSPERIETIAQSLEAVAAARDPVGMAIDDTVRPNGLRLTRLRIPIGVIGIIYESRPNVTADAAALCLKSGNAVILRGGSEASNSNHAIHAVLTDALSQSGMPDDAVQLVATTDRAVVGAMLTATGLIDLIIPRAANRSRRGCNLKRVCLFSRISMASATPMSTSKPILKKRRRLSSMPKCGGQACAVRLKRC